MCAKLNSVFGCKLVRTEKKTFMQTQKKLRLHHQLSYLFELINDYQPVRCLRSSPSALMKLPPLDKSRTQTSTRAFRLATPKIWSNPPAVVRESTSLSMFCRILEGHLVNVFEWSLDRPGAFESSSTTKYGAVYNNVLTIAHGHSLARTETDH